MRKNGEKKKKHFILCIKILREQKASNCSQQERLQTSNGINLFLLSMYKTFFVWFRTTGALPKGLLSGLKFLIKSSAY